MLIRSGDERMPTAQDTAGDACEGDVVVLCAEEEVRDVIAYWLSTLPLRSVIAESGYHASKVLGTNTCRLLVTDRVLPPWPGLDTFLGLRARHPKLRIAFVDSGNSEERLLARVTGATEFLARPLSRRALLAAVGYVEGAP
jgi:DNA-binding response OmpR family regulator